MSKIFYPSSEKLKYLLESIHQREIALPDFQRDFVWDPRETEELVESICQNFPAGSLLRIKNSAGFYFAPREFSGAPALSGHAPSYLILDGQQRLTSLYQAFYGVGNHRYFIDLRGLIDGQDLEDTVFYLRKSEAKKQYGSLELQAKALVFPFQNLFGEAGGFEVWLDQILEFNPISDSDKKLIKQRLRDTRKRWLGPAEDYEFPMVTLSEDTSAGAVCTIFETLNRTGVKLSVFDLLAARFWPEEIRLRDLWEQAQKDHQIIGDFEVDPYYLLQAVAIVTAKAAPSCKRKDVLDMTVSQIKTGWSSVVHGLAETLQILRNDCGVVLPQWLPYNTILIPAAAIIATTLNAKGPEVGAIRNKLKRWFWCSVFGQAYEKAPNSQAVKDFSELKSWFTGGSPPQTVSQFSFDVNLLRQTTPRQRALYRGVIALILRNGALDFHSGNPMTAASIMERKIEDHHIFPQAFLAKYPSDVSAMLRDCILNRTLIDKETNGRIGKRAPSKYLEEMDKEIKQKGLESILRSHLLPAAPTSSLRQDQFEEFLQDREQLIAKQLKEVTE